MTPPRFSRHTPDRRKERGDQGMAPSGTGKPAAAAGSAASAAAANAMAADDTESENEGNFQQEMMEDVREAENVPDDAELSDDGLNDGDADAESRRKDALEHMARIEKEFAELKDRLYKEKMAALEKEIEQISSGAHPEFSEHIRMLERKKSEKIRVAEVWRTYQSELVESFYAGDRQSADDDFISEKHGLREQLLGALHEKIKRLEEEKNSMDVTTELSSDLANRVLPTRKLRRRGMEQIDTKAAKKKITTGPVMSYSLKETEIFDDLYQIRKGFSGGTRRTASAKYASTRDVPEQERTDDIYHDNGALYYENHRLEKGSQVYIENKETGRYAATITAINNSEVWVRRTDGSKTKLYMPQLRQGKYVLDLKV